MRQPKSLFNELSDETTNILIILTRTDKGAYELNG
jgi:hypothetical protein